MAHRKVDNDDETVTCEVPVNSDLRDSAFRW